MFSNIKKRYARRNPIRCVSLPSNLDRQGLVFSIPAKAKKASWGCDFRLRDEAGRDCTPGSSDRSTLALPAHFGIPPSRLLLLLSCDGIVQCSERSRSRVGRQIKAILALTPISWIRNRNFNLNCQFLLSVAGVDRFTPYSSQRRCTF